MLKDELEKILKKHALYEKGDPRGQKANLSGANLRGANLFKADLSEANLSSADLSDAKLTYANLFKANLIRANLSLASMFSADLNNADLSDANLSGANLSWVKLRGANLRGANLRGAKLKWANFSGADLRGARLDHDLAIPAIEHIDERILEAIQQEGASLDMDACHGCGTTHCRAGWAIVLAGEAGKALQEKVGSYTAGALIYAVSRPNERVPDFYASDQEAMVSIRRDAKEAQKEEA